MSFAGNVLEVLKQVTVLFILIFAGAAAGRAKWIDKEGSRQMTAVLLDIVTPCVIVNAFLSVEYSTERLYEMLVSFLCCVATVAVGAIAAKIFFRKKNDPHGAILRFGTSFSNCGFMSLPLAEVILGARGVFIVSVYVAAYNLLVWTYGVSLFEKGKKNIRKIILNPGVIGVVIGLVLFLLRVKLPTVIQSPVSIFASMNTPLAMIIVGFWLSTLKRGQNEGTGKIITASVLRLAVCPAVVFGLLLLCGIRGELLCACMIPSCAPTAANTSIFAVMFGQEEVFASRLVGICTLMSIVTMPLIVAASLAF